jgi:lipopolysaccharide/colanic/teichoic acid biosynthesis glycosyltransferase
MYKYFKRIIDCLFIIIFFPVWFFIFFVVSILIYFNLGTPIIFQQERIGEKGKSFRIYKFRSMTDEKDKEGLLLPDNLRLTTFGRFLRSSSLDELPSLFNVLIGKMSLVGPRPFISQYKDLYNPIQNRRHNVKPGITGWAQVNGRNAISWQQKFEYDVWYVENVSFVLDCKILFLTIIKVFKREGITAENSVSAEVFKGN